MMIAGVSRALRALTTRQKGAATLLAGAVLALGHRTAAMDERAADVWAMLVESVVEGAGAQDAVPAAG